MEAELRRYKSYYRNVKWIVFAAGLWPNLNSIFQKILASLTFLSSFVVMVTVSNFCFQNVTNIMVLTKGMGLAISFISVFMKVCTFLLHHEDLHYLNSVLTTIYTRDLDNREDRPNLLNRITTFTYFMYTHAVLAAVAMFMYSISPLLALRRHGKYVRAFPAIYPFAYEPGGLVHWVIYCVEVIGAASLWAVTVGVDCIFGVYALQMCGELRVLAKRFCGLRLGPDYKESLKDCIKRHHLLMQARNKLESVFGLIAIWLAISGALVLCSLIFQVSEAVNSGANFVHMAHLCSYLAPKFLQIFTYAWYGSLISEESGACMDSIYKSHWPDSCNLHFKNDILIVSAQKPLVLIAKGCMFIQLDMFIKIVKSSVSYFFLLRTLNDDNAE